MHMQSDPTDRRPRTGSLLYPVNVLSTHHELVRSSSSSHLMLVVQPACNGFANGWFGRRILRSWDQMRMWMLSYGGLATVASIALTTRMDSWLAVEVFVALGMLPFACACCIGWAVAGVAAEEAWGPYAIHVTRG